MHISHSPANNGKLHWDLTVTSSHWSMQRGRWEGGKIQGGKESSNIVAAIFHLLCAHYIFNVQYHPKERELLTFLQGDGSLQHKVQKKPLCWKRVELICSVTVLETHQMKKVMYTKYSVLNSSLQSYLVIPTLMPLMCDTTAARRLSLNSQMLASTSVHSYQCWSLVHDVVTAMSQ